MRSRDDPEQKIVLFNPQRGLSGFTRAGDVIGNIIPMTPPPADLFWTCEKCGLIEPFFVPVGQGRWIRRSCVCQKQQRMITEEEGLRQAWKFKQRERTFGWLGRGWEDVGLVGKIFATFARERQPHAYDEAVKFVERRKGNIAFCGPYGTGKTHLVAAICNALREDEGIASLFTTAPKLYSAYLDKLNGQEDHWAIIKQAISTPILVLDDIDKAKHTDTREELYYMIFDERVKAERPLVISTNKLSELARYIGDAACSRLMTGLVMVEMVGEDYREGQ